MAPFITWSITSSSRASRRLDDPYQSLPMRDLLVDVDADSDVSEPSISSSLADEYAEYSEHSRASRSEASSSSASSSASSNGGGGGAVAGTREPNADANEAVLVLGAPAARAESTVRRRSRRLRRAAAAAGSDEGVSQAASGSQSPGQHASQQPPTATLAATQCKTLCLCAFVLTGAPYSTATRYRAS